jgi:hypothetical protein
MKRLAIGFGLCLLLSLSNISANAQDKRATSDDSSSVRTTVRNYIEAYDTGDAHRMEQTLHPPLFETCDSWRHPDAGDD